jgi:hypothetical protein
MIVSVNKHTGEGYSQILISDPDYIRSILNCKDSHENLSAKTEILRRINFFNKKEYWSKCSNKECENFATGFLTNKYFIKPIWVCDVCFSSADTDNDSLSIRTYQDALSKISNEEDLKNVICLMIKAKGYHWEVTKEWAEYFFSGHYYNSSEFKKKLDLVMK